MRQTERRDVQARGGRRSGDIVVGIITCCRCSVIYHITIYCVTSCSVFCVFFVLSNMPTASRTAEDHIGLLQIISSSPHSFASVLPWSEPSCSAPRSCPPRLLVQLSRTKPSKTTTVLPRLPKMPNSAQTRQRRIRYVCFLVCLFSLFLSAVSLVCSAIAVAHRSLLCFSLHDVYTPQCAPRTSCVHRATSNIHFSLRLIMSTLTLSSLHSSLKPEAAAEPDPSSSAGSIIDMETFHQILDLDEDETHDFSSGMAWAYFEQAGTTFKEMKDALYVIACSVYLALGAYAAA